MNNENKKDIKEEVLDYIDKNHVYFMPHPANMQASKLAACFTVAAAGITIVSGILKAVYR